MELSKLITQCGEGFGALIKDGDKWAAAKKGQVLNLDKDFIYDTPEEAVEALLERI